MPLCMMRVGAQVGIKIAVAVALLAFRCLITVQYAGEKNYFTKIQECIQETSITVYNTNICRRCAKPREIDFIARLTNLT